MAHTLWFPPDYGDTTLAARAGLQVRSEAGLGQYFHKGDDVVKMCVRAGDHLFVDRLTYNFRPPRRGEIIVFATAGTHVDKQDEFFVKRLTVLPGERVQIGDDRHLIINGRRLDATTPHFEKVYGFDPAHRPPKAGIPGMSTARSPGNSDCIPYLAPLFPDAATVYPNAGDTYLVMGDNTCDSSDSRTWGPVPAGNVTGKAFFVYWPFTDRFGWGDK